MVSKRGFGRCFACHKEYLKRQKPRFCQCGAELGGFFVGSKEKVLHYPPAASVIVYSSLEMGTLISFKVTPNDDRKFLFVKGDEKICFAKKCFDLRSAYRSSGKLDQFTCEHIKNANDSKEPIYAISNFTDSEIAEFSPDVSIQEDMKNFQYSKLDIIKHTNIPTVVKLTEKAYAVIGPVSTTSTMLYVHVKSEIDKTDRTHSFLRCTGNECKKKKRRTKQASRKALCVHLHYVLLARKIKENLSNANDINEKDLEQVPPNKNKEKSPDALPQNKLLALKIQMQRRIPYVIPPDILSMSNEVNIESPLPCYEPSESKCIICGNDLGHSMFPQGSSSSNGNGYLLTQRYGFKRASIKLKKCNKSERCGAIHVLFPYDQGLFNSSNKVLIGLDILVEWREYMKDGFPISNIIRGKLESLLLKMDEVLRPSENEIDYLVNVLYDGFYGFEAMTEHDLNEVICGHCGIVGRHYFGDGNEKNCCSLKHVVIEKTSETTVTNMKNENETMKTQWLENTLLNMQYHLLEKSTFGKSKLDFSIHLEDIPPIIPSSMRQKELNSEAKKRSIYLRENQKALEGDAAILSQLLSKKEVSISEIDTMDAASIIELAKKCKIRTNQKSQDFLKLQIYQLYSTILVGTSPCHEYVRSAGHTGGFYHIVCPHGTTVCSKFMVLTESVRDAADLWLSLKYPPLLFVCDTPCTFVQHINNRESEIAKALWGDNDGCFEKPILGNTPSTNIDVPSLTAEEFQATQYIPAANLPPHFHPLTSTKQRYVCGDWFHSTVNPHISPLCSFHNIDLCLQATTIKTSYQESINNRKNQKRNRSSCTQGILHHMFLNYLMNFYENEEIVRKQKRNLEKATGKEVKRDEFFRFIF